MDFSFTMYFRQKWHDYRLTHNKSSAIILPDNGHQIWIPDLYIIREKTSYIHELIYRNKLTWIYKNGNVVLSARVTAKVSCPLRLHYFPMDRQSCIVQFMSYSYCTDYISLRLSSKDVAITDGIFMPSFDLLSYETAETIVLYTLGNFSACAVKFDFARQVSSFLLVVYAPSFVLVVIAWLSFWIDAHAAPARVSLAVTLVLTINTMTAGVQNNVPVVTYAKAIDVWLAVCMTFVFSTLVEYALANYLLVIEEREYEEKKAMSLFSSDTSCRNCMDRRSISPLRTSHEKYEDTDYKDLHTSHIPFRLTARKLDRYSRIVFPVVFIMFNIFYWLYFTTASK